ncbi:hypothetical protein T484DRAFT_2237575 [Baffinella frigidus]|nr:hypothetical protein T484DRAFT_2237575 [Cryptophyta sp. CCMP2293]
MDAETPTHSLPLVLWCFGALVLCFTLTSKATPTSLLRRWEQSTDELPGPTHSSWTESPEVQLSCRNDIQLPSAEMTASSLSTNLRTGLRVSGFVSRVSCFVFGVWGFGFGAWGLDRFSRSSWSRSFASVVAVSLRPRERETVIGTNTAAIRRGGKGGRERERDRERGRERVRVCECV